MTATLRYRGDRSNILEFAKTFDAFKKVPEKYTETTEIGGTLSLLSRLLIVYLVYTEVYYYWNETNVVYKFHPDIAIDEQVQMHVDITVAMPCSSLSGIDLTDETQQDVFAYGTLQREGVFWEMKKSERERFESMQLTNHYLREEYHSVADLLFKDILREREPLPPIPHEKAVPADAYPAAMQLHVDGAAENQFDACRLHGTLGINKVSGVLHLVGGAQPVVGLFDDHWSIQFRRMPSNFSHRINRLSFGQYSRRIVQPLEGDETYVTDEATTVQYFLKVVPTEIHQTYTTINTYQYAVSQNVRKLDSERNSYGSPGIYFKYDWSALKITVRNSRDNLLTFIIRLCSVISGIIVISGIVNAVLLGVQRRLLYIFAPHMYQRLLSAQLPQRPATTAAAAPKAYAAMDTVAVPGLSIGNELLNTANLMASVDITPYLPTAPTTQPK